MDIFQGFYCLEFDNDFTFDQKVETMFANLMILVEEWNWFLPNECNPAQREFNR